MDINDYEETKQRLKAEGWGPLTERPCGTAEMAAMCSQAATDLVLGMLYPNDEGPIALDVMLGRIEDAAVDMAVGLDVKVRAKLAEQHVNDPPPTGTAQLGPRNLKKRGGK